MRVSVTSLLLAMVFFFCGCRLTDVEKDSKERTAIRPNASLVDGVVTSLDIVDSLRYKVSMRVLNSRSVGSLVSLVEAGQHVVALPQFMLNEDGRVDGSYERNRRLLEVRAARPGDTVSVKIALAADGRWMVLDKAQR